MLRTDLKRAQRLHEARGQAAILGVVLWITAGWLLSSPGPTDRFGRVKGTDFAYFYTIGTAVREGHPELLYDPVALHSLQADVVRGSDQDYFYSVYPPQVALVFAPIASLPYLAAFAVWALITLAAYAWAVRSAWTMDQSNLPTGLTVAIFAASFPPLWYLILHGQSTAFVIVAFGVAGAALRRSMPFVAGLALGLLACKPQWAPVPVLVLLAGREWRVLSGCGASVAAQLVAASGILGLDAMVGYVAVLPSLATLPLAPKPFLMHSITAWTNLLPGPLSTLAWLTATVMIVTAAVRAWSSTTPITARMGIVVLASALASPHFTVYDATVLALPLIWWGALVEQKPGRWPEFYRLVFALWVCLLFPTALLIGIQISILVLVLLLWRSTSVWRSRPG